MTDEPLFRPEDVISRYTRADALRDGVLVDVTEWASHDRGFRGGFHCAMAVTRAVWSDIENIPAADRHQDIRGRTHDALFLAMMALRRNQGRTPVEFDVILSVEGAGKVQTYRLVIAPSDDGLLPVGTIMRPEES